MGLFGSSKKNAFSPAKTVHLSQGVGSAVNLEKVRADGHLNLVKQATEIGVSLKKRDLVGIRADVVLVLDHSLSMVRDYDNGSVQKLVERALAFGLQVDVDGNVPVIAFDSRVYPAVNVTVMDYANVVNDRIWRKAQMGSTNLAAALGQVQAMAELATKPLFVIVATDGNPDSRTDTTSIVCKLAEYPVFLKFLALRPVEYLQELDKLPDSKRLLDNVNAKPDKKNPNLDLLTCDDRTFAEEMVDEFDDWILKAQKAGVIA